MHKNLVAIALIAVFFLSSFSGLVYAGDTSTPEIIRTISLGDSHGAVVSGCGYVYTWGFGGDGRLGFGDSADRIIPTRVPGLSNIKSISMGTSHSAAITNDGYLYMWGNNCHAQLGRGYSGEFADRLLPERVHRLSNVTAVSLGRFHSAAITENGNLYIWGCNSNGQLGLGDKEVPEYTVIVGAASPQRVTSLSDVIAVSLGDTHSAAITANSNVYSWGDNQFGQLGLGDKASRRIPTPVLNLTNIVAISLDGERSAAISGEGELHIWGRKHYLATSSRDDGMLVSPKRVQGLPHVSAVGLGESFTIAIADGGRPHVWGYTNYGVLGLRDVEDDMYISVPIATRGFSGAVDISVGLDKAAFLYINGVVYIWGNNRNSQLGLADTEHRRTPTRLISNITVPGGACVCVPSVWAGPVIASARSAGLLAQGELRNYRCEVGRVEVAQLFINLIELATGQSITDFMYEKGVSINENAFIDTADSSVLAAHALGILRGQGDGRFNPNGILLRGEIAAILNRTANVFGVNTDGYSHSFVDMDGHWADDELGWAVHAEIIFGMGENRFVPNRNLTAEEAIVIVYRAYTVFRSLGQQLP